MPRTRLGMLLGSNWFELECQIGACLVAGSSIVCPSICHTGAICGFPNFLRCSRNREPVSVLYSRERLELISQKRAIKESQNQKEIAYENRKVVSDKRGCNSYAERVPAYLLFVVACDGRCSRRRSLRFPTRQSRINETQQYVAN